MPRSETPKSMSGAKKVVLPRVKFTGQQPGEERVEKDNDDEKRVKEPSEIPPRPPKGEPPYRKL